VLKAVVVAGAAGAPDGGPRMAWGFHWDDVPADLVAADLVRFERARRLGEAPAAACPPWGSNTFPGIMAGQTLCPGAVTPEAAAVRVPVLCAMGERDVVSDPGAEPGAFRSSPSVDLFVCPRMGHMHNFASTRELFWQRIDLWAQWVALQAGA
jgi:pimeloyl-ACP methyl ester carboxylesterase